MTRTQFRAAWIDYRTGKADAPRLVRGEAGACARWLEKAAAFRSSAEFRSCAWSALESAARARSVAHGMGIGVPAGGAA